MVYLLQSDSSGFANTDVNRFANLTLPAAYDANGNSKAVLTTPTDTLGSVKILRLAQVTRNGVANAYGAFAVAEVVIAKHENMNAYQG